MAEPRQEQQHLPEERRSPAPLTPPSGLGADWWSVIVGGALVALAAASLLPKVPW